MNYLGVIFICTINVICINLIEAASVIRDDLVDKSKQESKESLAEEGSSRSFYPFITCQQCDTFLQCFLRCPFAEYPGINRLGIYVPEGLKGMAHVMGYKESTRKLSPKKSNAKLGRRPVNYKHRYKNYKPFNPSEIKEKYLYANRKDKIGKPSRRE